MSTSTDPGAPPHPLDNVVWHSLTGPLARFKIPQVHDDFVVFDPEIAIFGAVEEINPAAWAGIAECVGEGGFCGILRDAVGPLPPGWTEHYRDDLVQMVAGELPDPIGHPVERLGPKNAEEMLAITRETEASPFMARTFELGRYVGVRRNGRLIAMAGERFRVPGFAEVSAVCTYPEARGEGLATELTLNVVRSIRAGGDEAFLHASAANENAIRLYTKLGFNLRRKVEIVYAQWTGEPTGTISDRAPDRTGR